MEAAATGRFDLISYGKDGKVVNESYTQDPATLPLFSPSVPKGVRDVLVGKKVGSRVITA